MAEDLKVDDWVEYSSNRGLQRGKIVKVAKTTVLVNVLQFGKLAATYRVKKEKVSKINPDLLNLDEIEGL
ncbi:MAG: hypothetical protein JXR47_06015 [Thiotrichales bacterium]|nr:hypothetical protein [Thiotrichales bacterium]